jgi:hypothetical protein
VANFLARLVPPHLWARAHFSRFDPKSRTLEQSYSAPGCSAFAFKVTEHLGIREVQLDSSNPHECATLRKTNASINSRSALHCPPHLSSIPAAL